MVVFFLAQKIKNWWEQDTESSEGSSSGEDEEDGETPASSVKMTVAQRPFGLPPVPVSPRPSWEEGGPLLSMSDDEVYDDDDQLTPRAGATESMAVLRARRDYALSLGIDPSAIRDGASPKEPLVLFIDACLRSPPLPPGWSEHRHTDGETGDEIIYYSDTVTGESTWTHPIDHAAKRALACISRMETEGIGRRADRLTASLMDELDRFAGEVESQPCEWSGPYSLSDSTAAYLHTNTGRVVQEHPVSIHVYSARMMCWLFCVYFSIPAPPRELLDEVYHRIYATLQTPKCQPDEDPTGPPAAQKEVRPIDDPTGQALDSSKSDAGLL
ncbi:hypothetical protein FOZ61_008448 [Perkinsus olseni]|uniref:WW domain-containing protein n=1 Tax=Perkinsus olseni TaxID=32597 RepID=A0A7J6MVW2_PEROL|nr:hypothetical protein FOZ61_008448 [Perkinsus olseni]KAF4675693.1 hypothetical protein FOL46_000461 [Perkinsus olseni]